MTDATPAVRSPLLKLAELLGPLIALLIVIVLFTALDRRYSDGQFATLRNFRTLAGQTTMK